MLFMDDLPSPSILPWHGHACNFVGEGAGHKPDHLKQGGDFASFPMV